MKIHEIINEQKLGDIPLGHAEAAKGIHSVSYTHLTLPTIYSV